MKTFLQFIIGWTIGAALTMAVFFIFFANKIETAGKNKLQYINRGLVLENNTTMLVHLNPAEVYELHPYDTVWVNMRGQYIDNVDTTTMKVVLLPTIGEQGKVDYTRDYQIDITDSITYVYDGDRLVGKLPFTGTSALDTLMLIDNR